MASGAGTGIPVLSCVSSKPWDIGLSAPRPFNTTLLSHGRAPFAEIFTLLRPNEPAFATSDDTPGESARIWVKLRLESGTPLSILLSTAVPSDDVVSWRCGASAAAGTGPGQGPGPGGAIPPT